VAVGKSSGTIHFIVSIKIGQKGKNSVRWREEFIFCFGGVGDQTQDLHIPGE
jgi:hypothetical protein